MEQCDLSILFHILNLMIADLDYNFITFRRLFNVKSKLEKSEILFRRIPLVNAKFKEKKGMNKQLETFKMNIMASQV